jgi:hypothetical protein
MKQHKTNRYGLLHVSETQPDDPGGEFGNGAYTSGSTHAGGCSPG